MRVFVSTRTRCQVGTSAEEEEDMTSQSTMRAAVLNETGTELRVETLVKPAPKVGEVLLRVKACGVCHTDLHVIKGEVAFPTPCVLGHEVSGVVEAVGPGVSQCAPGDRVAT